MATTEAFDIAIDIPALYSTQKIKILYEKKTHYTGFVSYMIFVSFV